MGGHCNLEAREYDSSCLSCWQTCPRRFYYTYILRLQPRATRVAMDFGEHMHSALSTRSKEGLPAALATWDSWPPTDSALHTRERGIALTKEFDHTYGGEQRELLGNEVVFKLGMVGGSTLSGRIDLIVKRSGFVYVLDYKTTSRLGPAYFDQFRPHLQMTTYTHACRELVGECAGVIISAINTSATGPIRFQEEVSSRSTYELDLFALETYPTLVGQVEEAIKTKRFPLHESNCYSYYVMCPFDKLCIHGCTQSVIELFYDQEGEEGRIV